VGLTFSLKLLVSCYKNVWLTMSRGFLDTIRIIEIAKHIKRTPSAKVKSPSQRGEPDAHKPGLVRDMFEKTTGVASAAFRISTNLVSGTFIGGFHGARKGGNPDYEISPSGTAVGQVALNTVQGQANAAITGFMVGGPPGMATSMVMDAVGAGTGVYFFVKNGSAKEVGKRLADAIDQRVEPGEGVLKGMAKGAGAGAVSAVKAAAITGFREGKGSAAGMVEGSGSALRQFGLTRAPKGSLLHGAFKSTVGVVTGLLAAPVGAVLPLLASPEKREMPSLAKRLSISAASGAVTGAAMGSIAGLPGMVVGATLGTLINLAGPSTSKEFAAKVLSAVRRTNRESDDLGSLIANENRNLTKAVMVGAVAGGTKAWNAVVREESKPANEKPVPTPADVA
jgi:hypothetical protein